MALLINILILLIAVWVVIQIDQYEKEPLPMLLGALMWGALPSTLLSFLLLTSSNTLLVAFIEESIKLLLISIYFITSRHELDNPIDSILYSLLIGLGFNFTETFIYSIIQPDLLSTIFRSLFLGANHGLWTSVAALGLYNGYQHKSFTYAIGGITSAVGLHYLYNTSIILGLPMSIILLGCLFQLGFFILYIMYEMKKETLIVIHMKDIPDYKEVNPSTLLKVYRTNKIYMESAAKLNHLLRV
jgi:RsiW-degrading membrane proteinase PrsW (M82 family)